MSTTTTTIRSTATTGAVSTGRRVFEINLRGREGILQWIAVINALVFLLAFCVPAWVGGTASNLTASTGLWQSCGNVTYSGGWFTGVQIMMCFALACVVVMVVLVLIYNHAGCPISRYQVLMALAAFSFLGMLFLIIGMSILGGNVLGQYSPVSMHLSFVLAIFSTLMCLVVGIFAVFILLRS